jgi:hypothetical protein
MNQREKILAGLLILMIAAWGGKVLLGRQRTASALRERDLETARQQLDKSTLAIASGRHAKRQFDKWQELSLPSNRDVAHSLYRAWLLQKLKDAGLAIEDISPNERTSVSTAYQSIGYVVEAKGTLSAVTKFLYEFYRGTQLQQISKLQLTSTTGATDLHIQLQIEALILPGAKQTDKLPEGKSDRLKLASAADYEKSIVGRDLFKPYTPPRPPRETVRTPPKPPVPKFDEASQAYVTGIVKSGDKLQAWINVRTTGETLRVQEGDDVEVGALKGKVESIEPRLLVVKTDDEKLLRVQLGHSLREEEKEKAKGDDEPAKPAEAESKS